MKNMETQTIESKRQKLAELEAKLDEKIIMLRKELEEEE